MSYEMHGPINGSFKQNATIHPTTAQLDANGETITPEMRNVPNNLDEIDAAAESGYAMDEKNDKPTLLDRLMLLICA